MNNIIRYIYSQKDEIMYLKSQDNNALVWNAFSHITGTGIQIKKKVNYMNKIETIKHDNSIDPETKNDTIKYYKLLMYLYDNSDINDIQKVMQILYESRNTKTFDSYCEYYGGTNRAKLSNLIIDDDLIKLLTDCTPSTYVSPKDQIIKLKNQLSGYEYQINELTKNEALLKKQLNLYKEKLDQFANIGLTLINNHETIYQLLNFD